MFTCDDSKTYISKVPELLSPDQCAELIQRIEDLSPTIAPINSMGGTKVRTDIRNNERVMFDDKELANSLFQKVKHRLPEEFRGRRIIAANERFRCYRYKPGMRFAPHADGSFERNETEKSFYTFLVYLNDDFVGGETNFFTQPEVSIEPKVGLGLLFQHPLLHEGAVVQSGVKYVARSDIMYQTIETTEE